MVDHYEINIAKEGKHWGTVIVPYYPASAAVEKLQYLRDLFSDEFKNPWGRNGRAIKYHTPAAEHVLSGKYIVNLTKKQYINFDEYYEANQWKETWTDDEGIKHESVWCIHPLPILTACGNGLGGGDYHGSCMGIVGEWAFDEIKIVDRKPSFKYHQINPTFVER